MAFNLGGIIKFTVKSVVKLTKESSQVQKITTLIYFFLSFTKILMNVAYEKIPKKVKTYFRIHSTLITYIKSSSCNQQ